MPHYIPMKNRFDWQKIRDLSDGTRSMAEIAEQTGYSKALVDKVLRLEPDLPRRRRGSFDGERNGNWKGGNYITLQGYLLANNPQKFVHRSVMEQTLGRDLLPTEVVDHIDGCTLNNRPENLRVFPSNAAHLAATRKGLEVYPFGHPKSRHDANHRTRVKRGEIRELQILLAHAALSEAEFSLLKTERYISPSRLARLLESRVPPYPL